MQSFCFYWELLESCLMYLYSCSMVNRPAVKAAVFCDWLALDEPTHYIIILATVHFISHFFKDNTSLFRKSKREMTEKASKDAALIQTSPPCYHAVLPSTEFIENFWCRWSVLSPLWLKLRGLAMTFAMWEKLEIPPTTGTVPTGSTLLEKGEAHKGIFDCLLKNGVPGLYRGMQIKTKSAK